MKWFKHDSDAGSDAKLRKLRLKYGAQGYGIYWYCLELIARNVDKNNLTFELEHDADLIADDFKLSAELVQEMMTYMVNLGLFENVNGIITCLKMASRTDEYTQKLLLNTNTYKSVGTLSGQNPEKSELIEENRTDKIRIEQNKYTSEFEQFWSIYPKKIGKDAAFKSWKKLKPRIDDVMFALSWQKESKKWLDGYITNPATYLNQGRWKDEPDQEFEGVPF